MGSCALAIPAGRANPDPSAIANASGDWQCIEVFPSNHTHRLCSILPGATWIPQRRKINSSRHVIDVAVFIGYAFTTASVDAVIECADILRMVEPHCLVYSPRQLRRDVTRLAELLHVDQTLSMLNKLVKDAPCRVRSGPLSLCPENIYYVVSVGPWVRLRGGMGNITEVPLCDVEAIDVTPKLVSREHRRRHREVEAYL